MCIAPDKSSPFLISGHGNGTTTELFDGRVHLISVAFKDASKSVVCFLNLANDNRFKLTTRVLEVEVGLLRLAHVPVDAMG